MGRSLVVVGAVLQPVRRPGRRPRARRPRRARVVARCARQRVRRPLRALAGASRSGLPRKSLRVQCRVRARPRRRDARDRRRQDRVARAEQTAATEADQACAICRGHRAVGVFKPRTIDAVNGTELIHIWLEHMLVHSMLQHPSGSWTWGRYVVVYPSGNSDVADACARYRDLLADGSTFSSVTVEDLLDADVLPAQLAAALRERYFTAPVSTSRPTNCVRCGPQNCSPFCGVLLHGLPLLVVARHFPVFGPAPRCPARGEPLPGSGMPRGGMSSSCRREPRRSGHRRRTAVRTWRTYLRTSQASSARPRRRRSRRHRLALG